MTKKKVVTMPGMGQINIMENLEDGTHSLERDDGRKVALYVVDVFDKGMTSSVYVLAESVETARNQAIAVFESVEALQISLENIQVTRLKFLMQGWSQIAF